MFEGTKKNAYTQIKRVFLLFLLAFFAYIHTFVEWHIVHIDVHSTKNATPMESRSYFILISYDLGLFSVGDYWIYF